MQYLIEPNKSWITVISEEENLTILVDQQFISIIDFLEILIENAVEPCHVQNVYDDIIN